LFGELKVMLGQSASTRHIVNNYPLNRLWHSKAKSEAWVLVRDSTGCTRMHGKLASLSKNYLYGRMFVLVSISMQHMAGSLQR
jgi:hypothetical protein